MPCFTDAGGILHLLPGPALAGVHREVSCTISHCPTPSCTTQHGWGCVSAEGGRNQQGSWLPGRAVHAWSAGWQELPAASLGSAALCPVPGVGSAGQPCACSAGGSMVLPCCGYVSVPPTTTGAASLPLLCPRWAPQRGCSLSLFLPPCAGSWRCVQDISVLLSLPQPHGALLLAGRGCFLPGLAWWWWGLLASLLRGEPSRLLHKPSSPLSLVTRLLVVSGCCLAPSRPGCREVPSLILLSFGALIAGQRWSWVRGLTPISRAGSHRTLLSNSSRSSVFKTSSKNHQEGERQARSFPLPTNSNGAGIMDSHQHACRQPPARERGSAFSQGQPCPCPRAQGRTRGLALLLAVPGAVLPEHTAQGSLPDLYQQRCCDSSCLPHLLCAARSPGQKRPRRIRDLCRSPEEPEAAPCCPRS